MKNRSEVDYYVVSVPITSADGFNIYFKSKAVL